MDHRAVVALLVILGKDLPVPRRRRSHGCHPPATSRVHTARQFLERCHGTSEGGRLPRPVDEDEAVPLGARQLGQTVLVGIKSVEVFEPRRRPYLAVERVGPGVIRADHPTVTGGGATRKQFVSPVAAHVGEPTQRPSCPRSQDSPALPRASARWSPGWPTSSLRPVQIHSRSKNCRFPVEELGQHRHAGKHATVPERQKRPIELDPVERGGFRAKFE